MSNKIRNSGIRETWMQAPKWVRIATYIMAGLMVIDAIMGEEEITVSTLETVTLDEYARSDPSRREALASVAATSLSVQEIKSCFSNRWFIESRRNKMLAEFDGECSMLDQNLKDGGELGLVGMIDDIEIGDRTKAARKACEKSVELITVHDTIMVETNDHRTRRLSGQIYQFSGTMNVRDGKFWGTNVFWHCDAKPRSLTTPRDLIASPRFAGQL